MKNKVLKSFLIFSIILIVFSACSKKEDHSGHDHSKHDHSEHINSNKEKSSVSAAIKQSYEKQAKIGDTAICPVMGSKFKVNEKSLSVDIKGKKYYLCCKGCVEPIKKDPDKYLKDK